MVAKNIVDNQENIIYNVEEIKKKNLTVKKTEGDKMALSDNAKTVLAFLQNNVGNFTQNDIADATSLARNVMTGTVNGLVRKGLVTRVEDTIEVVVGDKTKTNMVKYVKITDMGAATDVNAE